MKLDVKIKHHETLSSLVGPHDRNLAVFKHSLNVKVSILNDEIIVETTEEMMPLLNDIFRVLVALAENKVTLTERDILYIIKMAQKETLDLPRILSLYKNQKKIVINDKGKAVVPKTFNQKIYSEALLR